MSEPNPEWLILGITLLALAMAPLASRLVRQVGEQVSRDSGSTPPGDEASERAARDDDIAQMLEARAYLRSRRDAAPGEEPSAAAAVPDDLREEVRQLVVAGNERRARRGEEPLDVETEIERRLARHLGA